MAQFTAQGRLKLLFFNGDGLSVDAPPSINPLHLHKRKISLIGSTNTRVFASSSSSSSSSSKSSSSSNKSKHFGENKSPNVGNYEDILNEQAYESDELSCFRGLVLDISYR